MKNKLINKTFQRKNIKSIIDPKKDFLVIEDILKNAKYLKEIYSTIHSEIIKFIEKSKKIKYDNVKFIKIKNKKNKFISIHNINIMNTKYLVKLIFHYNEIDLYINNNHILTSNIYGASFNKEYLKVSDIKTDLASIKKEISLIN